MLRTAQTIQRGRREDWVKECELEVRKMVQASVVAKKKLVLR